MKRKKGMRVNYILDYWMKLETRVNNDLVIKQMNYLNT